MTELQKDVWWLAKEILSQDAKAIDPETITEPKGTRRSSGNPKLDWAISYMACIPEGRSAILRRMHEEDVPQQEARRAGAAVRWFYRKLQQKRLFGEGIRMLENMNR